CSRSTRCRKPAWCSKTSIYNGRKVRFFEYHVYEIYIGATLRFHHVGDSVLIISTQPANQPCHVDFYDKTKSFLYMVWFFITANILWMILFLTAFNTLILFFP